MERPKHYEYFLEIYNKIKHDPRKKLSRDETVCVMIVEFQQALEKGILHFDIVTGEKLDSVKKILESLVNNKKITIELKKEE